MKYLKINTDCWFTLLVLLFVMEILKKSSKNDQLLKIKIKALKMAS